MNYWLIKTEPSTYSWSDMQLDGTTFWNGVRNYAARNNLNAMKVGDSALFYHSGDERQIVGVVKVVKAAYPDTTAYKRDPEDAVKNKWVMVDVQVDTQLKTPVTLKQVKAHPELSQMKLVKQGRLSVSPVTEKEYKIIMSF